MAKLYFRYGAMNSGKSTALMQVAHNYEEQGMRVLILKPQVDTKGGGELVSRLGVRRRADLLIPPEVDVFEAVRAASAGEQPLACVLCDESQFFTPAQAEQLFMVTVDLNIPVICYGLRSDFSLKGFPGSTRLLELAHTIEEMKTISHLRAQATCTAAGSMGSSSLKASRSPSIWKTMCSTSACAPSAISRHGGRFTPNGTHSKCRSPAGTGATFLHESPDLPKVFYNFQSAAQPGGALFCLPPSKVIYQLYPTANVFAH